MTTLIYDADIDPSPLAGQTVAVIGFGSQGEAHARNLADSGVDVVVGLRPTSASAARAREAGLRVTDAAAATAAAQVVMILVPDTAAPSVYATEVEPNLQPGALLMFAHGFNIHFGTIDPPAGVDVGMVAPKGPGHLVRQLYEAGGGVPALFAVHRDETGTARARTLAYARGIGAGRAGILETTFAEETETDLFGEQAVLCGGVTSLVQAGFETLVDAGYQPELAYFETMHELKLIVDLMYQGGLQYMRFSISDTAEYGDYVAGPRLINDQVRAEMRRLLDEIQDGSFARRWIEEGQRGAPEFRRLRAQNAHARIEERGRRAPLAHGVHQSQVRARGLGRRGRRGRRPGSGGEHRLMARRIQVFDTTLRDGEQTPGASLTVDEKVQVARQLARLRVDVIEAGFPAASPGEALAVRRIATEVGAAKGAPAIAALARCVPDDVTAAAEALAPARRQQLHVFIATSDIHLTHKLRATRAEVLERITACVAQARALVGPGQQVEFSAEDASRTETPFLLEAYETALAAGASIINVPDTVGYAEPDEFAALVRQVVRMVGRRGKVSVHCHNDLGLATANTLAAIRAGARQVEVTVNGLGERAGNASLEEIVMTLRTRPTRFRGAATNVASDQLTATSRLVSFLTGISVQPNKSVVGANAFAHESGIHQDGFLKNALTYEIMTPESVGLTGSTLTLGKLSGRRGFNERLRRLGIELEPTALDALYGEAIALADHKKQVTDADLIALADQRADPVPVLIRLEHWAAASRQGESSSGNVSLFFDGRTYRAFAGGNGPVDALLKAVDNALEQIIGGRPTLVDYQLRSIGSGEDAQGEAMLKIAEPEPAAEGGTQRTYTGHGLSTNVVEASLRAYLAAVNKLIAEHPVAVAALQAVETRNPHELERVTAYRVVYLPGDGVGPEVLAAARDCVDALGAEHGFSVTWEERLVGGAAIDAEGAAVSDETVEACAAADAVLLGAVGGPQWDDPRGDVRPEQAILRLRRDLGLFANLRPVRAVDALASASPLRPEVRAGTDMLIVRELTGGLYFGKPQGPTRPRRGGHLQLHPPRGRAHRAPGLHPGFRSAPPPDQRRQGQRDGHRPTVARGGRRGGHRVPGRHDRARPGRLHGGHPDDRSDPVRRDRHREPVRRHPQRRSGGHRRLARPARLRQPGRSDDRSRSLRPVRTDPRQRAGHRRARIGQSGRRHRFGGHDAALVAGTDRRRRRAGRGAPGGAGSRTAHAGPGRRRHHRRRCPRPSSPAWPSARGSRHDHARPAVRHDPAGRDPAGRAGPVAGRQAAHRPPPGRGRFPVRGGRLAGVEPQGRRILRGRAGDDLAERPDRGLRLDPTSVQQRGQRSQPPHPARGRHAGGHHLRQELAAARHRRPGRHRGREPGHDR